MTKPPTTMTTDQLITEISGIEPDHLPVEVVRRCFDLLAEMILDETRKGGSVDISHFGQFSPSPDGGVIFQIES